MERIMVDTGGNPMILHHAFTILRRSNTHFAKISKCGTPSSGTATWENTHVENKWKKEDTTWNNMIHETNIDLHMCLLKQNIDRPPSTSPRCSQHAPCPRCAVFFSAALASSSSPRHPSQQYRPEDGIWADEEVYSAGPRVALYKSTWQDERVTS